MRDVGEAKRPRRASSNQRRLRQHRIAEGLVRGRSISQLAVDEGLSRVWASKEAHSPECELAIGRVIDTHRARVEKLVPVALDRIEQALEARRVVITSFGEVVDAGPDHRARMRAVRELAMLATAGRTSPAEAGQARAPVTYEQFLLYVRHSRGIK